MFWKHLRGVRDEFQNRGSSHKERIDRLTEAVLSAPPDVQKEMLKALGDVNKITSNLRTILAALLPPEITNGKRGNGNGGSRKSAG
jgi:hypothetical protein